MTISEIIHAKMPLWLNLFPVKYDSTGTSSKDILIASTESRIMELFCSVKDAIKIKKFGYPSVILYL